MLHVHISLSCTFFFFGKFTIKSVKKKIDILQEIYGDVQENAIKPF
jgi:hypothetical protein